MIDLIEIKVSFIPGETTVGTMKVPMLVSRRIGPFCVIGDRELVVFLYVLNSEGFHEWMCTYTESWMGCAVYNSV